MTDLKTRFRSLDRIAVPDLWAEIEIRTSVGMFDVAPVTSRRIDRSGSSLVPALRWLFVAAVLGLFAVAAFVVLARREPPPLLPGNVLIFHAQGHPIDAPQVPVFAVDPTGGVRRQIAVGNAWHLDASPDGRLAFIGLEDGILIARTDGSGASVIGADRAAIGGMYETAWSSDSRRVAWPARGSDQRSEIDVADVETGEVTRIPIPDAEEYRLSWSRDGRHLILAMDLPCVGPSRLYDVDTQTLEVREVGDQLLATSTLVSSPDGRTLAVMVAPDPGWDGNPDSCERRSIRPSTLVGIDVETRAIRLIEEATGGNALAWTPNGQAIRYLAQQRDHVVLRSVPATGGGSFALMRFDGFNATWSPDASRIAWYGRGDPAFGLFVADVDALTIRQVAGDVQASGSVYWPKWSPDGQWIAFQRGPFDLMNGEGGEVWVVRVDGTDEHRLIDASFGVASGAVDW